MGDAIRDFGKKSIAVRSATEKDSPYEDGFDKELSSRLDNFHFDSEYRRKPEDAFLVQATHSSASKLLGLPAEIRRTIYRFVINSTPASQRFTRVRRLNLALLRVNHQLYQEAGAILFNEVQVYVLLFDYMPSCIINDKHRCSQKAGHRNCGGILYKQHFYDLNRCAWAQCLTEVDLKTFARFKNVRLDIKIPPDFGHQSSCRLSPHRLDADIAQSSLHMALLRYLEALVEDDKAHKRRIELDFLWSMIDQRDQHTWFTSLQEIVHIFQRTNACVEAVMKRFASQLRARCPGTDIQIKSTYKDMHIGAVKFYEEYHGHFLVKHATAGEGIVRPGEDRIDHNYTLLPVVPKEKEDFAQRLQRLPRPVNFDSSVQPYPKTF